MMDESKVIEPKATPGPVQRGPFPVVFVPPSHDGWKSRRAIASSLAAGIILVAATILLLVSGLRGGDAAQFFHQDTWIEALWVVATVLGVGWGCMTIDKAIELLRLIWGRPKEPKE
jgi:hypothetical protein